MSSERHDLELQAERDYVTFLYHRLDVERGRVKDGRSRALADSSATGHEARWEREVSVTTLTARERGLRAADVGLCFGRIDDRDNGTSYIGRVGLFDDDNDYQPFLLDWRTPAARPFYCATAANPEGVALRRHFHTNGRVVLDFHDERLDLESAVSDGSADGALLAALNAPRTETMRDIVATIQAEQDEIIRLGHHGVVVIEGGPGTGKTAVALHRVAYLLYTRRDRLARRGVLVVGPNPGFLRYIGRVLPSLGETDVVFATRGTLFPGLRTTVTDPPATQRVKGSLRMVDVLTAAVADRQELPDEPIPIELSDVTVPMDRVAAESARERARATGLPHNRARAVFRDALVAVLTDRAVQEVCSGWLEPGEAPEVRAELTADIYVELSGSADVAAAVDRLWPILTPRRLLADLFESRRRIAAASGCLTDDERDALYRPGPQRWSVSDVPLLDEAVELLGELETSSAIAEELKQHELVEYARGVLEILDTDEDPDGELLRAVDLLDAESLSDRQSERDLRDLAERAAADREWTYGHVVVDEAQELSEMDWRVVMRRCPSRSMTIVGDLAQRAAPAGARSWTGVLDRYVSNRWVYRGLTVNYRTPVEIMDVAARVLAEVDPKPRPPVSVRAAGVRPWARRVAEDELADAVAEAVAEARTAVGTGTVAVITERGVLPVDLTLPASVLVPATAKGLEFDAVIVVEPQRIIDAGLSGASDLYVALTRATQRLGVLHTTPLPAALSGIDAQRTNTKNRKQAAPAIMQ